MSSRIVENGRASNLMKSSTKRKRTRQELEEVKQEEEELKNDKQVFLQMVKRLKDEKAALEEQVEQLFERGRAHGGGRGRPE